MATPAATALPTRTCPRSAVQGRFGLNRDKPGPIGNGVVARTGETDLCAERDVPKAISLLLHVAERDPPTAAGHIHLVHEPVAGPLGRLLSKWWRAERAHGSGWRVRRDVTVDNTDADYGKMGAIKQPFAKGLSKPRLARARSRSAWMSSPATSRRSITCLKKEADTAKKTAKPDSLDAAAAFCEGVGGDDAKTLREKIERIKKL